MIQTAKQSDLEDIVTLWKSNRKSLGIPWRKNIANLISKGTYFIIRDNATSDLIGMCAYQYMPKKQEIWILALAVDERYRRQGYGRSLLEYTINAIPDLLREKIPIYINYLTDDENNGFYEKFNWEFVCFNYFDTVTTEVYRIPISSKHKLF